MLTETNSSALSAKAEAERRLEREMELEQQADVQKREKSEQRLKKEYARALQTLRGVASKDVISGFRKILGEPVHVSGSHFVFKHRDGGITYPMPDHGNTPMAFGILKDALEMLGVSPIELQERV